MATYWDLVTDNSSLPLDPVNTFWDHLNNQKSDSTALGGIEMIVKTPAGSVSQVASPATSAVSPTTKSPASGITVVTKTPGSLVGVSVPPATGGIVPK